MNNLVTISQLKALCEDLEAQGHGDKVAGFAYNFGDRGQTEVVSTVSFRDEPEVKQVRASAYHSKLAIVDEYADQDRVEEPTREVVILPTDDNLYYQMTTGE